MEEHARTRIESNRRSTGIPSRMAFLVVAGSVVATALGGCVYSTEKERVATTPQPVVVMAPAERVVTVPADRVVASAEGRWQLYGDGTSTTPYYWAWIPAGANPPAPPPPRVR